MLLLLLLLLFDNDEYMVVNSRFVLLLLALASAVSTKTYYADIDTLLTDIVVKTTPFEYCRTPMKGLLLPRQIPNIQPDCPSWIFNACFQYHHLL